MVLVAIAWMYVVGTMAVAEATSPSGTLFGALFTLLLYGALPLAVVLYVLGAPGRRRRRIAEDEKQAAASAFAQPHGSRHAAGDAVAPEREEP